MHSNFELQIRPNTRKFELENGFTLFLEIHLKMDVLFKKSIDNTNTIYYVLKRETSVELHSCPFGDTFINIVVSLNFLLCWSHIELE